jgi:hypothetical protein
VSDTQLDLRALIARIDRDLADAEKLRVETRKLVEEASKLRREPWLRCWRH